MSNSDKICIIGAGPGGLAAARALRLKGIDYDQFDAGLRSGGLWDIERPDTPLYDSAHLISSKTLSGFPGFPMPDAFPDYPKHDKVQAYLMAFAERYGLSEAIRFETPVEKIQKGDDGRWTVTLPSGEAREYLGVICATGAQWQPLIPDFKGSFSGEIIHSSAYRSPSEFEGKRVLIVGAGNSGCDIACDAANAADATFMSMRRGYHFIPKHVFGKPADVFERNSPNLPLWLRRPIFSTLLRLLVGDVTRYGIPKPDHRLFETHPILNTQLIHYLQHGDVTVMLDIDRLDGTHVLFKDGTAKEIDLILCATGFTQEMPFAKDYFAYEGGRPKMFLQIFSREHHNLFGISYFETNSGSFGIFGKISMLIANYLSDQMAGRPSAAELDKMIPGPNPDLSGGITHVASDRHTDYMDSKAFQKHLDKLAHQLGWPNPSQAEYDAPARSASLVEQAA